ncbi:MAG TPA: hypothetical protein H9829_06070 [Candidatus Tetragenococcus pullicola]|nr:hypothetical protein [Candidatus Tetragenococcus pullicola]
MVRLKQSTDTDQLSIGKKILLPIKKTSTISRGYDFLCHWGRTHNTV